MNKIITLVTTDPRIHRPAMFALCASIIRHNLYPLVLLPTEKDLFKDALPYNKITLKYFRQNAFKILEPIGHIQLQDHDEGHRELLEYAKKAGVKTYVVQHGLCNQTPERVGDSVADYLFAWSESEKKSLELFYPSEQIIVTGNPGYDVFPRKERSKEIENILFATNSFQCTDGEVPLITEDISKSYFNKIFEMSEAFPDKIFFLKTHPSSYDDVNWYFKIIQDSKKLLKNVALVEKNEEIITVLKHTDLTITYPYSTIQSDSAISGIPVIDIAEGFDIIEEIKRIEAGEEPRSNQYKDIPRDTNSGDRVIDFILEVRDAR